MNNNNNNIDYSNMDKKQIAVMKRKATILKKREMKETKKVMNQSKKVLKAGLTYSEKKPTLVINLKLRMILKHKEKEENMKEIPLEIMSCLIL